MAVNTGWFDVIGHLDLPKRYAPKTHRTYDPVRYRERLVRIFDTMIERGVGFEINTSGLRQTPRTSMPGPAIVRWYVERGGRLITTGTDSHAAQTVGAGREQDPRHALLNGFEAVASFRRREPTLVPIAALRHAESWDERLRPRASHAGARRHAGAVPDRPLRAAIHGRKGDVARGGALGPVDIQPGRLARRPTALTAVLAAAGARGLLPVPEGMTSALMGLVVAGQAVGVGRSASALDRPGPRPYWQMGLYTTLVLMPTLGLQAAASRVPFVAVCPWLGGTPALAHGRRHGGDGRTLVVRQLSVRRQPADSALSSCPLR